MEIFETSVIGRLPLTALGGNLSAELFYLASDVPQCYMIPQKR